MATRNGSFSASVNANIYEALQAVNAECYKIARELFLKIVALTPSPTSEPRALTAKGVLVNNWYPVDGPGFSTAQTDATSSNGAGSILRINGLRGFGFFRKDGTVTLSNNIHYAVRAEILGWPKPEWSGRVEQPYRMVARSLQAIAARYK